MRTTTDLSNFGWREFEMTEELIRAAREQGFPKTFNVDEVTIMMNQNSGNVFFTNSEYEVAMINGYKLESFYFLSYHGDEGFADELYEEFKAGNIKEEDFEQLVDILEAEGMTDEAEDVRSKIKIDEEV